MKKQGVPTIYYGDEAGLFGAKDPDCRRSYQFSGKHSLAKVKLSHSARRHRIIYSKNSLILLLIR
ncbi:hypothetical protein U27_02938 [Candidatus Vecturithrix granuli]|uniref:Uncharacterized protein n=1 Tax=Vecturithrix granuli TaxID=1499967 RepID=A0A081BUH2_VECG1|nr:hypothetical protein U27_02938 [Candidatus Vecturithrix granuli]